MSKKHREPSSQTNEKTKDRGTGESKIIRNGRSENRGQNYQKTNDTNQ